MTRGRWDRISWIVRPRVGTSYGSRRTERCIQGFDFHVVDSKWPRSIMKHLTYARRRKELHRIEGWMDREEDEDILRNKSERGNFVLSFHLRTINESTFADSVRAYMMETGEHKRRQERREVHGREWRAPADCTTSMPGTTTRTRDSFAAGYVPGNPYAPWTWNRNKD